MWRFLLVALTTFSLLWCLVRCSAGRQAEGATTEPTAKPRCRCCRHRSEPQPAPERRTHDDQKTPASDGGGCANCLCHGALRTGTEALEASAAAFVTTTVAVESISSATLRFAADPFEGPPVRSGRELSLLYGNLRR